MEEIKDRVKMIMDREKLTAGAFADSIGASQATISHILSGRNKPSVELILRVHQRYADINLEWLLTGKGNMSSDSANGVDLLLSDPAQGYPLFTESAINPSEGRVDAENRKEMSSNSPSVSSKEIVKQEFIYKEKPSRKITEIRIFFDDNTYETFKPSI